MHMKNWTFEMLMPKVMSGDVKDLKWEYSIPVNGSNKQVCRKAFHNLTGASHHMVRDCKQQILNGNKTLTQ